LGVLEAEEHDGQMIEPTLEARPAPRGEAAVRAERTAGAPQSASGDDDHLEIPAFLRRQAN
jgi:cell division protein FtsZ